MHILMVADGRSPTAVSWLRALVVEGHRVTLVSTYPCARPAEVEELHIVPVAFSGMGGGGGGGAAGRPGLVPRLVRRARGVFQVGRYWLGPLSLPYYARALRSIIAQSQPDLVHAFRIPFEGMLAAAADPPVPLVVSVWGNELTLHAYRSPLMRLWTRHTLRRADGLLADASRDLRLARQWGFSAERPALVLPGGGGVDLAEISRLSAAGAGLLPEGVPASGELVVNPRGIRPDYVRNEVFFEAVPLVLQKRPGVIFACPAMLGHPQAEQWVRRFEVGPALRLLPNLPQAQLWALFQRALVSVSISVHDGTPNTLLEAMACGCFPIAGDLESLREWITPGVNGLLVEAHDAQALADAMLLALGSPDLRQKAAAINLELIRRRAEVGGVRAQAQAFYQRVLRA